MPTSFSRHLPQSQKFAGTAYEDVVRETAAPRDAFLLARSGGNVIIVQWYNFSACDGIIMFNVLVIICWRRPCALNEDSTD